METISRCLLSVLASLRTDALGQLTRTRHAPHDAAIALRWRMRHAGCASAATDDYYGTLEPFAAENVYFVLTDRFVNGDPGNDQREQGGAQPHLRPADAGHADGVIDNVGYLGGDFKGIAEHVDYIRDMGFTAVWLTPIVDNPDEAFTGGDPAVLRREHERWRQDRLSRLLGRQLLQARRAPAEPGPGLRRTDPSAPRQGHRRPCSTSSTNHGSPSFTMPVDQPKYGEIYAADGKLLADHQNLAAGSAQAGQQPAAPFLSRRKGSGAAVEPRRPPPRGARLFRRRLQPVAGSGRRCAAHRHHRPYAARVLEVLQRSHPRAPAGHLPVRRALSPSSRRRSPNTPGPRTAR